MAQAGAKVETPFCFILQANHALKDVAINFLSNTQLGHYLILNTVYLHSRRY